MKKKTLHKKFVITAETLSQMQLSEVVGASGVDCPSNISGCQTKPVASCFACR
jgi:hypothetical protein